MRKWDCSLADFVTQVSSANEDRFLAKWIAQKSLSKEAQELYNRAYELYKYFYGEVANTHWKKFGIENWDVGLWQIKQALKDSYLEKNYIDNLKDAHKKLGENLLKKLYNYQFIYPDVELFEEN